MRIRYRRLGLVVAAIGALTAAGSLAYASIPDVGGTIHGCYDTALQRLRVIDTASDDPIKGKCLANEKPIELQYLLVPNVVTTSYLVTAKVRINPHGGNVHGSCSIKAGPGPTYTGHPNAYAPIDTTSFAFTSTEQATTISLIGQVNLPAHQRGIGVFCSRAENTDSYSTEQIKVAYQVVTFNDLAAGSGGTVVS